MSDNWIRSNEVLESEYQYWVDAPNQSREYIGFFVKFYKKLFIDDTAFIYEYDSEFTGCILPHLKEFNNHILEELQKRIILSVVAPIQYAIQSNKKGLAESINDGEVILSTNIFLLDVNVEHRMLSTHLVYSSVTSQSEMMVNQMGIFN